MFLPAIQQLCKQKEDMVYPPLATTYLIIIINHHLKDFLQVAHLRTSHTDELYLVYSEDVDTEDNKEFLQTWFMSMQWQKNNTLQNKYRLFHTTHFDIVEKINSINDGYFKCPSKTDMH